MTSADDLREARWRRGWTQVQAAARLRVSQAYLSFLETGRRRPSQRVFERIQREYEMAPTALPFVEGQGCDPGQLAAALGGLGCPGFSGLQPQRQLNPAQVLLLALQQDRLEPQMTAALPWLVIEYHNLDWDWLIDRAKRSDCQNRLGFVVSLARQVALRRHDSDLADRLSGVERRLEPSRLAREDSFDEAAMTDIDRRWLRLLRTEDARRWNMLSDIRLEGLPYAT